MPIIPIDHRLRGLHDPNDPIFQALQESARTLYNTRLGIASGLPRRFSDAIPSLRVVSIADEEPHADYDGTSREYRSSIENVKEYLADWDEHEYQDLWYTYHSIRSEEWWRVVREGEESVRLEALTQDQAWRVQRFLEDSDFAGLDRIDGE